MIRKTHTFVGGSIYLACSTAMLGQLPRHAAIITDPPYGMGWDTRTRRFSGGLNPTKRGGRHDERPILGDDAPFDPSPWVEFREVILWGCNHFSPRLPVGTSLVWIKRNDPAFGSFLSDAELAWKKGGRGVYCFKDLSMNAEARRRVHPTQKPIGLMRWCVSKTKSPVIIDPFMGSGSTGVAALLEGRGFIGIEADETYFDTAKRRIDETVALLQEGSLVK